MKITNIRTFIPSKDFAVSKQFYLDIGFEVQWEGKDLVLFGTKNNNFFVQNYYNKDWAENLMMQMHVNDLDALYKTCKSLMEKYEGTKIKPIFSAEYGRTFHIIGPAGELWHMTEVTVSDSVEEDKLICEDN